MRRLAISLLLFVAFAVGVVSVGFALAVGVARGAPVVSSGDAPAAARSASPRWGPSSGPQGGPAFAIAVAPSAPEIVYVGTRRGVFRSVNGGRSWASAGLAQPPGPYGGSPPGVTSLAVDPRTPSTLYAGLNGPWDGRTASRHPVFKSTNGGRTWRALDLRGQVVASSPTGHPTVYAAAAAVGGTSRLFRSTDGGRSWEAADRGLPSTDRWALAFDPTAPATVYAAMGPHGVFESSDGGARWRALGISATDRDVTAVAVDPQHPKTVYAGTDAGVIKSLDGGRSWRLVNAALGSHGRDRACGQVSALVVDPRDSRTMYASTFCTGVFKSADGGRRWSSVNSGLEPRCAWAYSLALDPRARQTVYVADSAHGVFASLDGGAHWHAANTGLSLSRVFSLAGDPQTPGTVYASADELGLFKSSDRGAHWQALASGPKLVDEVALDPSNPRTILAVASGYGVVRSTDAGRTWAQASLGAGARLVHVVAISGKAAYAGGRSLFGSTDGGHSWRELGGFGAPGAISVQALAIAPTDTAVVYASIAGLGNSDAGGLYRSTDGGSSWQRLTGANGDAIALDPDNPAIIYFGTTAGEGGVFKSTDGGSSWQPANSGLQLRMYERRTRKWITTTLGVTTLLIDPLHPTTLYAAATGVGQGVYRSTDAGKSWQPFDAGLTALAVTTLALDATGQTLYAGTAGGGVVSVHPKK